MPQTGQLPHDSGQARSRARYRIAFGKQGVLRYTAHLDVLRMWERTLRRAGIPIRYSQGYNPRPQIRFAAGLPLGFESKAEFMDVWLEGEDLPTPEDVRERLLVTLPEGLTVGAVTAVEEKSPALQTLTRAAEYTAVPGEGAEQGELARRVEELMAQDALLRTRRKKTYDLRPLIHELEVLPGSPAALRMVLSLSQEEGTGRPDEVLDALGLDPLSARVTRQTILFSDEN